jgi:hypothetical protein
MRVAALIGVLVSLVGPGLAAAADRVLSVEAEVMGPKEKSLGKAQMLVAARGTERVKSTFGSLTLVLDADVGPTFDKECNLVTINARLEDSEGVGPEKKREFKATTVHACGKSTPPTTLTGGGTNTVVVTIRPAPTP